MELVFIGLLYVISYSVQQQKNSKEKIKDKINKQFRTPNHLVRDVFSLPRIRWPTLSQFYLVVGAVKTCFQRTALNKKKN
jgi:hypothetical protein